MLRKLMTGELAHRLDPRSFHQIVCKCNLHSLMPRRLRILAVNAAYPLHNSSAVQEFLMHVRIASINGGAGH